MDYAADAPALHDLNDWEPLPSAERERQAHAVAARLPDGFRYLDLRRHSLGAHSHEVPFFAYDDSHGTAAEFALIPGGTVWLG
jgi:hypothetical protein